jgi:hypothetical protein
MCRMGVTFAPADTPWHYVNARVWAACMQQVAVEWGISSSDCLIKLHDTSVPAHYPSRCSEIAGQDWSTMFTQCVANVCTCAMCAGVRHCGRQYLTIEEAVYVITLQQPL